MTSIRHHSFHADLHGQSMSWKEQVFLMFCVLSAYPKVADHFLRDLGFQSGKYSVPKCWLQILFHQANIIECGISEESYISFCIQVASYGYSKSNGYLVLFRKGGWNKTFENGAELSSIGFPQSRSFGDQSQPHTKCITCMIFAEAVYSCAN
jgi:hypothetical protein